LIEIKIDTTGAERKTRALLLLPEAANKALNAWAASAVKALKRKAAAMQRGYAMGHGKTGQLARNISMQRLVGKGPRSLVIGTGVAGTKEVKYATIQDQGGDVTAKNAHFTIQNIVGKPNLGPYLTVPLKGVKGRMADYPGSFVIRSKKGNLIVVQPAFSKTRGAGWRGSGYAQGLRALFVLKYQVHIPASHWFTGTMSMMEMFLPDERAVLDEALDMDDYGGRT
jgi:hypothetical protein